MTYACLSNERFLIEVLSDSREDVSYEVSIQNIWLKKTDKVVRAWRCSCPGWMVHHISRPGYECKHIRQIKKSEWCGWRQSIHGGKAIKHTEEGNENPDYTCPNCGNFAYPEDELKIPEE